MIHRSSEVKYPKEVKLWSRIVRHGDKLRCLPAPFAHQDYEAQPEAGQVYTVREIVTEYDKIGFRLVEIINPVREYRQGRTEVCFLATHFEPAETAK